MYATMEDQWLIKNKQKNSQNNSISPYKIEVATIFTTVTDFDNEHKFTTASKLKLLLLSTEYF